MVDLKQKPTNVQPRFVQPNLVCPKIIGADIDFGGASVPDALNFTMPNGGDITLFKKGTPTDVTLEYSTDNGDTWTTWAADGSRVRTLTLQAGETVYIRNASDTSTGFSTSSSNYYQFSFTNVTYAGGPVDSLLCKNPSDAVITNYCYAKLFQSCSTLATAPSLPSTTLASYCYYYTFAYCRNITTAPSLPATSLAISCYVHTFSQCYSLTTAPELPATTLKDGCYYGMFADCVALETAPELPASRLETSSYYSMFGGCSSLKYVKTYMTDISATNCLSNWLSSVAASGTLYCPAATAALLPSGVSGIPTGWTQIDI